jgi:hypothetical protein
MTLPDLFTPPPTTLGTLEHLDNHYVTVCCCGAEVRTPADGRARDGGLHAPIRRVAQGEGQAVAVSEVPGVGGSGGTNGETIEHGSRTSMSTSRHCHCWTSKREWCAQTYGHASTEYLDTYDLPGGNATCLLPEGHDGPHEWTSDGGIVVEFKGLPAPAAPAKH